MKKSCACLAVFLFAGLLLWGCSNENPVTANNAPDKTIESFPISGTLTVGETLDLGRWMTTPSGLTHVWGYTFATLLTGNMSGTGIFVQSGKWDATYTGVLNGKFTMDQADINGVTGSLVGQFHGELAGGWLEGNIVLQGAGGLDSYHAHVTMVGPFTGPYQYSGEVMVDEGN